MKWSRQMGNWAGSADTVESKGIESSQEVRGKLSLEFRTKVEPGTLEGKQQ